MGKDGLEAVMMVKENAVDCFDCILMDIQMPKMNGFEACKVIRSLPDDRNKLPIIDLTANAFEEDRKDCLDAGMSEHVSKPIEIQSLLQTIESVLKNSGKVRYFKFSKNKKSLNLICCTLLVE